jgi:hypothetical protein
MPLSVLSKQNSRCNSSEIELLSFSKAVAVPTRSSLPTTIVIKCTAMAVGVGGSASNKRHRRGSETEFPLK